MISKFATICIATQLEAYTKMEYPLDYISKKNLFHYTNSKYEQEENNANKSTINLNIVTSLNLISNYKLYNKITQVNNQC